MRHQTYIRELRLRFIHWACPEELTARHANCPFGRSERISFFGVVRCVGLYVAFLEDLTLIVAFWEAPMRYAFARARPRESDRHEV
jgi:hypothetical protein